MSEQSHNKQVIRRAYDEVYNKGNLAKVDELISRDFVVHLSGDDVHGPEALKGYVTSLREAFPDLEMTIDDQIADGDKVVTRWTARGTHTGSFQGLPPTGKRAAFTGVDIDRFVDGKAVECWTNTDELGLMQQLGAIPEQQAAQQKEM
jgi:steroid delta-isomerase-like uncharacterized protein